MEKKDLEDLLDDQKLVEEEPIFKKIDHHTKVTELITAEQIDTPYLKHIFNGDSQAAIDALLEVRQENFWEGNYEQDVMLAFFFAIHQEDITVAAYLMDYDPQLRYIATLAYHRKKECRYDKNMGEVINKITNSVADKMKAATLKIGGGASLKDMFAKPAEQTNQNEGGEDSKICETGGRVLARDGKLFVVPNYDFEGGAQQSKSSESSKIQMEGGANSDLDIEKSNMTGRGKQESGSSFFDEGEGEEGYGSYMGSSSSNCSGNDSEGWGEKNEEEDEEGSGLEVDDGGGEDDVMISGMDDAEGDAKQVDEHRPPPVFQLYHDKDFKGHPYEFMHEWLKSKKIGGLQIEKLEIRTKWQIQKIKVGLQLNFPNLMTSLLEILLYRNEEDLSCYLTAFYDFNMIKKKGEACKLLLMAIEYDQFKWLNYVWAFKKNYYNSDKKKKINLIELFEIINFVCDEHNWNNEGYIEKVCKWFLDFAYDIKQEEELNAEQPEEQEEDKDQENILQALLHHKCDELCLKYMGHFACFLNKQLFLFSLLKNNKEFIQQSLLEAAFDKQIFKDEDVVSKILEYFQVGSKTIFLLNTMILTDVSLWKNEPLSELIAMFSDFGEKTYEENSLLQSCNPLQCITLSCELLLIIGSSRKRFENECISLRDDLLELGKVFNGKIEDQEYYKTLLYDVDFQNRTVLKIITLCNFEPLLSEENPLSNNIMNQIFIGDGATECDGTSSGFCSLLNILEEEPKAMHGNEECSFYEQVTLGYEYNTEVDYAFQHRYRTKSIQIYFYKDLIFGFCLMMVCLLIWQDYLKMFRGPDGYVDTIKYQNGTTATKLNSTYYEDTIYDFHLTSPVAQTLQSDRLKRAKEMHVKFRNRWYPWQLGVSSLIFFQAILRLGIFKIFKQAINSKGDIINPIEMDKYLMIDLASGGFGFFVFFYVCFFQTPESLIDEEKKNQVDAMVAILMVLILSRFFILQLVVPSVSKMMLTLFAMLWDVMPFNFIMFVYLMVSVQTFSTWLQDINPDPYEDPLMCFQTQFDNMLGGYSYQGVGKQEYIYTGVMIFHLFLINILLLNFMVAILSNTYCEMLESGSFLYKCSLFQYCEKYMIAFQDERIGELMIHSPPLNLFSLFMLPALLVPDGVTPNLIGKMTQKFSYLNFWVENIFIIIVFIAYELCLLPFAYLLTFYNLMVTSNAQKITLYKDYWEINVNGTQMLALNWFRWLILGVVYLMHMILKDIYTMIKILSMYQGCIAADPHFNADDDDDEELTDKQKMDIYNEVRRVVIQLYVETQENHLEELKKAKEKEDNNKDESSIAPSDAEVAPSDGENDKQDFVNFDIEFRMQSDMAEEETWDPSIFQMKINHIQEKWREFKSRELAGDDDSVKNKKPQKKNDASEIGSPEKENEDNQDDEDEDAEESRQTTMNYPQKDDEFVEEILSKFLIDSESSFLDTIDIGLLLQALPNKIVKYSLKTMQQFNFQILQKSLIAFQTAEQVDAFEYFDGINMDRVEGIKGQIADQKKDLEVVVEKMGELKNYVQKSEDTLQDFEELFAQYNSFKEQKDQDGREQKESARLNEFEEMNQKKQQKSAKKKGKK